MATRRDPFLDAIQAAAEHQGSPHQHHRSNSLQVPQHQQQQQPASVIVHHNHHPPYHDFQSSTLTRRRPPNQLQQQQQQQGHRSEMDLYNIQQRPMHEMRRPDSVITTSSVVSSSDTASQSGCDSVDLQHHHNVYTISGLYGGGKKAPSEASSSTSTSSDATAVASTNNDSQPLVTGMMPKTSFTSGGGGGGHRRQASHPGNFDGVNGSNANANVCVRPSVNGGAFVTIHHPSLPNRALNYGTGGGNGGSSSGHKRSNSYGHHRTLTGTCSLGGGLGGGGSGLSGFHRRTGSSVIETLQTFACSSGGDGGRREDSLAQFLENLKKEQQEKIEKQELHEMQDELEDLRDCGMGSCRPKFMQGLANIKFFVFLLSLLVTLQQALSSGYLNSVITTIEKRYEIPSSISGIIASMYEIGNVITVIFVSYLGSRRQIPVWIGMGVLVMGIASITFSLPHFLSDHYMVHSDLNTSNDNICKVSKQLIKPKDDPLLLHLGQLPGLDKIKSLTEGLSSPPLGPHNNNYNRENNCIEAAKESSTMPIFIFMVAQLLLGCGGSPLFTLGTTYIDNHVKRDDSSMYIGIMYSMCAFGPVCGFLLGAYLLQNYVDTFSIDVTKLQIDTTDRHWIGMWWGGFLICGASLVLIAIPFFFFPKELKKEKVKVYIDEKYHHATDPSIRPKPKDSTLDRTDATATNTADTYGKDIKDIPKSIWKLLTNKIYIVTCMGACMELIIVSGFIVFLPKYLETQFNLGKSMASMFTGGIAIPGACIGIFFGGYILKRLQLKPKGAVQMVIFFNFLCLACYTMLFFFGCENVKMAGTTRPYFYSSNQSEPFKINLTASCNFGCECNMNDVQPVCGANGLTYFSPCHAGCKSLGSTNNFTDCACVLGSHIDPFASASPLHGGSSKAEHLLKEIPEVTMVPVATDGPCYSQCQMIMPFMVLLFFMTLVVAVTQMPVLMLVLRSVEEEEKAFALGIQFVIFRLFGYIPSPILFGNVIDSTCLLWKKSCDGQAGGSCLMYDIEMFRYKYVGVCCGIKILSLITFIVDWWLIRKRQNAEKKSNVLSVGEVVNSIISLDKLFDPDGPLWVKRSELEDGGVPSSARPSPRPSHRSTLDLDLMMIRHRSNLALDEAGDRQEGQQIPLN